MTEPADDVTITDVHAHILLPALQPRSSDARPRGSREAAALDLKRNGAESLAVSGPMVGARIPKLTEVGVRLAAMDAQGVDRQWVSASPNHFYPWAPEGLAVWVASEANRLIAEHVAQAPDRLTGLGLVPLQHPSRIVECLDDAVLGRGLAGVEISSFAGDVELSDERLEPFWARADELGAVVFLHPFGCSLDERLDRFYLSNTVGQPAENAVALSHLIFAGVLDRHPELKIVAAHGGGYLPFAIGRSDRAWRVRPEAQRCEHEPSTLPAQALVRHGRARRRGAAAPRRGGRRRRGCCSAATSRSTWASTIRSTEIRAAGLPDEITRRILGENAEALLETRVRA